MSPHVGDVVPEALAAAVVLDGAGTPLTLGDFWRDGPCLLVFLRHFGCTACSEHVTELSPRLHELARLGLGTVFVGNGEARYVKGFVERHSLGDKAVTIVTDPTLRAFAAAGLERSWWATLGARAIVDKLRGMTSGHRQAGLEGDLIQQGGTILVEQGGRVTFYHRNAHLGDHANPIDVVDAAMRLWLARHAIHV